MSAHFSQNPPDDSLEFVVAAHNAEKTLTACVSSLLAIRRAWRVTAINDASDDATDSLLSSFTDPRLQVFRVYFKSRAKTSNLGFRQAKADYVCSVDADVTFIEDRFDDLVQLLSTFPLLILTENPSDKQVAQVNLDKSFQAPRNSFIFSRKQLPSVLFSEVYPRAGGEDTDLAIRLLKTGVRIGMVYGGYIHARTGTTMGIRRRLHFHIWNFITYLRHLDVPMIRRRLLAIGRNPFRRIFLSLRQEYGRNNDDP